MRILIKILNILAVLFVIIGIASSIYWINEFRHRNDIDPKDQVIDSLQYSIDTKVQHLESITETLNTQREQTAKYKDLWQKANVNLRKVKEENTQLKKVENLPIDEMLTYILEYFNSDTTDATLVQQGDSIFVVMQPRLIDSVGMTIAKYQDNIKLLDAYEIQISTANDLIDNLELEKSILTDKYVTLEDIHKDVLEQNDMYKISNIEKDKQIKRLKFQRVLIGVGGVILIVLVAL